MWIKGGIIRLEGLRRSEASRRPGPRRIHAAPPLGDHEQSPRPGTSGPEGEASPQSDDAHLEAPNVRHPIGVFDRASGFEWGSTKAFGMTGEAGELATLQASLTTERW
jgi:hypothetical protein